jgi:cytochrome c peroxidase
MGGDGLLVDVRTVQAYIDEMVEAPVLPPADMAAVARGKASFDAPARGCAVCHSGSYLTDDKLHTVLSPMSLDPADHIPVSNTPGLHGIFLAAPYFHDGRAATLTDVLTRKDAAGMRHGTELSPAEVFDLVAYMQSL